MREQGSVTPAGRLAPPAQPKLSSRNASTLAAPNSARPAIPRPPHTKRGCGRPTAPHRGPEKSAGKAIAQDLPITWIVGRQRRGAAGHGLD